MFRRKRVDHILKRIGILLILFLLLILPLYSSYGAVQSGGSSSNKLFASESMTPPKGVWYQVPIIISNTQNISTGRDFQQQIVVNSSEFSSYEAKNLQNVEFFYQNGTVIPAWLEYGNTNNSYTTVYWVKLVGGIPAKANLAIYMGFAPKSINLLNASGLSGIGEAPQLSSPYAEYDDGAQVFNLYYNFVGSNLPKGWEETVLSNPAGTSGNYAVNNGLDLSNTNGVDFWESNYMITLAYFNSPIILTDSILEARINSLTGNSGDGGWTKTGILLQNAINSSSSSNGEVDMSATSGNGYSFQYQMGTSYIAPSASSNGNSISYPAVLGLAVQNTTQVGGFWGSSLGFLTQQGGYASPANMSTSGYFGLFITAHDSSGTSSASYQYVLSRAYPPNGVMPTATVGKVAPSVEYSVSFVERGLKQGSVWYVTIGNETLNSTSTNILVSEPPGTYQYSIYSVSGYLPSVSSGNLSITSSNETVNIDFTFIEPVAEVPITLDNNQPFSTGRYQQFLIINSSSYSKYINANWSNVEFAYQNSTLIPAWIEYGNNNTTNGTVLWLKLFSIPASFNLTIEMWFLPTDVSILSRYGPTGESAELSPTWGEYDDGNIVFQVYADFSGPTLPSFWTLIGSAQFVPFNGVETVNGGGSEMGAVVYDGNLSGENITVFADTYYQGSADQQNFGVYANDPSSNTGDNGGVGTVGYTMGFDPYYGSNQIYYNGQSVARSGFWQGGTSYFSASISVNSTSINYTIIQMNSNSMPNFYYINYSANIVKQGGLFFSSSTGGSNSIQFIYDLEVVNSPPHNYMPSVIFGNISTKKYNVTFYESGLTYGTKWYLNISGQNHLSTTGSTITTTLMNGTYSYVISSNRKEFEPSVPSGNFTVSGGPITISVLFVRTYNISFTESGLPSATSWYVNISGRPLIYSNARTISVYLTNGSYTYRVGTANGKYYAKGGSFAVSGANISKSVSFTIVTYSVTFKENGLPAGTKWYLNVTDEPSVASNTSTISTSLSNGTYEYSVSTENKSFAPTAPIGSFTVDGNSVSQIIQFSRGYVVTFVESGLPPFSEWFVNISGQPSIVSNKTAASISLINGSYNYVVGMFNHSYRAPGGSFVISGSSITQYVNFELVVYPIIFTESGLPSGTRWYLNITNQPPQTSTSNSIIVSLPNSTYTFMEATSNKEYRPSASSGSFIVNGSSFTQQLSFEKETYNITFIESGLTSGNWYVNVSSTSQSFVEPYTISTITFNEQNGTYLYTIGDNYIDESPQIHGGAFVVNGSSVIRSVSFSRAYYVMFNGAGLPFLVNWEVKIGNQTYVTSGSNLIISLANGEYQYDATVTTDLGASITSSGNFTVENSNTQVNLAFTPNYSYVLTTFLIPIVLVIIFAGGTFVIRRLKR